MLLLVSAHLPLYPQSSDSSSVAADSAVDLGKIVVTATRTSKLVSEAPVSVSVITQREIASSPAKTVEDLLVTQPGVQATRAVAIGEGIPSSIIIRGIPGSLASSRTLILVDGIPTNASGTPFTIVNEIPMEAIERIEIVRGPHSNLYGANAVGGVINILTKEGNGRPGGGITGETSYPFSVADHLAKDAPASRAFQESGKMAYWNGNGTVSGGNDKAGFLLSGGYRSIGNYLLSDSAFRRNGDVTYYTKADNYDYAEYRLFGKGRWYLSDNCELSLHSRYFNSTLGFGRTKKIVPDSQDVDTRGNKFLIGPRLKWSISPSVQIKAGVFYRQVIGEFINEGQDSAGTWVPSVWESNTKDWQAESQAIVSIGTHSTITAGVDYLDNNADFGATTDRNTGTVLPHSFSVQKGIVNVAAYMQDETTLWGSLILVPAMRVDYHSEFGAALSPKLGLNYRLTDDLTLRASSGRSFRAPSLAELYMPDLTVNPDFLLVANPDLKPEYLWGSDAGVEYSPFRAVVLKLDVYFNAMQDLISQMVRIDSTGAQVTHRNISDAWSRGLEGEITWRAMPWVEYRITGTLQQSLDKTYNVPLDYIPAYTAGFKPRFRTAVGSARVEGEIGFSLVGTRSYLDFTNAGLEMTPDGLRLDVPRISLDPHSCVDLGCRVTFPNMITASAAIQNVLNGEWEEAVGTLVPKRFASITLGWSF